MGCLYKLTSPSGKAYIGITLFTFEKRLREHLAACRKGVRSGLYSALRHYGFDAFRSEVIQEAESWEELCALEVAAIKSHRTKGPHGYNMTSGGDGVPDISGAAKERHRRKSSAAAKKAWAGEMRDKRAETFRSEVFKERHRQATSIGTAKAYQDPAVRAKLSMSRQNPDYRAKVSGSVKALWDNPDYRARQVAIRRGRPSGRSEESLKRQSELMKSIIAERKAAGTYWN